MVIWQRAHLFKVCEGVDEAGSGLLHAEQVRFCGIEGAIMLSMFPLAFSKFIFGWSLFFLGGVVSLLKEVLII